ncbi:MAG: membrane protein insertion efficiency factor YidD [Chlamydiales bacterium]|nr:membrane protein insertion efficiency factor YidD [Chlamydiales bacterium]
MIKWLFIALVRCYQLTLSPFVGSCCRFFPTCSDYSIACIKRHGAFKGAWLTLKRLAKCHPFHPGGCDPAPDE